MQEIKQYRVKEGQHHGRLRQYGPGDVVELTETEAAGFLDKLVLVEEAPALESSEPIEDSGDYLMPNDYVLSEVFSGYLLGVLNKAGFKSTGQVFGQTDDVLLDIKGISNKSLEKIRQIQSELGV